MKKLLIISVISIFLISCGREYCQQKFPCVQKDSVGYREIANIDTIYIPMPADTAFIQVPADCADQKIIYKDGKTEYKILIKDKILTVTNISRADSIRFIYAFKNTDEYRKETQVKYVDVIKYKTPKLAWYAYGLCLLLIVWVTRKLWLKLFKFTI